jgi:hypothetical protein
MELGDPGGTSNEDLNAAGIARYVRLVLFRDFHFSGIGANWAREHSFSD